jgi:hypothetical protein
MHMHALVLICLLCIYMVHSYVIMLYSYMNSEPVSYLHSKSDCGDMQRLGLLLRLSLSFSSFNHASCVCSERLQESSVACARVHSMV